MSEASKPEPTAATEKPAANFNRLAHLYRWMELFSFGPYLARCRTTFLAECASRRRALVLGDGDGRFTARILRDNPEIEIDAADASPAMLQALLRRARPHQARVRTYCADIRDWRPLNPPYDLVVTHFFLDCLTTEEVRRLAKSARSAVMDQACWIVSEFAVPEGWFGRSMARPLVALLYKSFGLLTGLSIRSLPDHGSALRGAGFTLDRRISRLCGLLISEIWLADRQPERSS